MASADDVAVYILRKQGKMTAMKLQKLVYYAQAWHLVWEERPLFAERIEAWANGPVVPDLYQRHKGQYEVSTIPGGDASRLDDSEAESVEVVLEYYGGWPAHELSELTHRERPWMAARKGLAPGERGSREITHDAMAEYYDGLTTENV